jgi:hypothetical protein
MLIIFYTRIRRQTKWMPNHTRSILTSNSINKISSFFVSQKNHFFIQHERRWWRERAAATLGAVVWGVATPGVATAPGTVAPETVAAWAGAAAALSTAWVDVVTPGMAAWASAVAPGIAAWPRGEAVEIVILKTFFSEGGPVLKIYEYRLLPAVERATRL